ncbi:MAG TPA: type II toxin-antitoxin system VapC family toxin [Candidatus Bathyarchaeia archaeon]|nr:type II toxin-antitoxin system VapC family toxin [Candidatus Bathyarchaeia archaeon]
MRFWDSSAIVPLVCREAQSARCRSWLRADPVIVVWSLAATEVVSALARKRREGKLVAGAHVHAKRRLAKLEEGWSEVTHHESVRSRARRLLETHPVSAADALHLAAALLLTEEQPARAGFVTFDDRLADAAEREGFAVLTA